jgi:hypothetical protein
MKKKIISSWSKFHIDFSSYSAQFNLALHSCPSFPHLSHTNDCQLTFLPPSTLSFHFILSLSLFLAVLYFIRIFLPPPSCARTLIEEKKVLLLQFQYATQYSLISRITRTRAVASEYSNFILRPSTAGWLECVPKIINTQQKIERRRKRFFILLLDELKVGSEFLTSAAGNYSQLRGDLIRGERLSIGFGCFLLRISGNLFIFLINCFVIFY